MFDSATPITPSIGLEVTGVAGNRLAEPDAAEWCRTALDAHGVVLFRESHIGDEDLVTLSRMLGDVVIAPVGGQENHPEISAISRDPAKTVLAAYNSGTFHWHIDGATDEVPQKSTLLTALKVSDEGGDTEFANTYAAYDALLDEEKSAIANLKVVHSFATAQRLVNPDPTEKQIVAWSRVPSRVHPLVWTRANERKSLLLGATAGEIVGMSPEAGQALLTRLLESSTQPRFALRQHWRRGDLVLWDNTGMLHRAIPYTATSRRLMHRTTLIGEEAVA